jgi:hypothetical protein
LKKLREGITQKKIFAQNKITKKTINEGIASAMLSTCAPNINTECYLYLIISRFMSGVERVCDFGSEYLKRKDEPAKWPDQRRIAGDVLTDTSSSKTPNT